MILEILIFLSTLFPIFHIINSIIMYRENKTPKYACISKEKGFSIIIPCYNEENILKTSIYGVGGLEYENYEVIFINDGSTDNTMNLLMKELKLEPYYIETSIELTDNIIDLYRSSIYENYYVIDKLNGGKADSINSGIMIATHELIVTLDADSVLKKNSLKIVNEHFQDEDVVAGGGTVQILQGHNYFHKNILKINNLVKLQILDYLKGFYVYKASLARENALAIISGAFGVFNKALVIKLGGFRKTLGEDIDITLRVQQYSMKNKCKVIFIPEAICYTECPESWRDFYRQRIRWQKAFIDCVIRFKGFLINTFLIKSLSFRIVIEALCVGTISSLYTIVNLIILIVNYESTSIRVMSGIYFFISTIFNIAYSITAVNIGKKYKAYNGKINLRIIIQAVALDVFVYRFINLVIYLLGTILYFFNNESWNKVSRTNRIYKFDTTEEVKL